MTTPAQRLRSRALGSPSVPVGTAQMVCALLDIIDQQQAAIDELRNVMLGHERRIADINRSISRLNKVHGA